MYYKEQLISIRAGMEDILSDLERELKDLPEGSLYAYKKEGKFYYCQRLPVVGKRKKEKRIGISKNNDMVLALVRKKYVEAATQNIRKDLTEIERAIGNYCPISEADVMRSFCKKYPELSEGIYFGDWSPEEWKAGYKQPEFYVESFKSVSAQGENMRSGGEMYISSRLDHFGIPYRYEDDTGIPDLRYAPDFKILRPRDRKIIYWEHFGKVNDYQYVRENLDKVGDYIDYGIKPWDNFIMTFNNEKGGYDGKLIDAMIECWLL